MKPSPWLRWLVLLAVALLLAVPAWRWSRPPIEMKETGAAVAAVAVQPASSLAAGGSRPSAVAVPAMAVSASTLAKPEVSKEFIDVCGVGRIRRSELEPGEGQPEPAWSRELNRLNEQGLSDMLKRLDTGTLRQRVAAAALRGDAQAVAQLAAGSDDVDTYRIALQSCRRDHAYRSSYPLVKQQQAQLAASAASGFEMPELKPPGAVPTACAAISLERLEALDPGDAWPWLLRLSDAVTRRDEAGVGQALYQVAQRSRLSAKARLLSATVAEAVGPEPTPGESWALANALGTDMLWLGDGSPAIVGRSCRADALKDANRRQLCEQVVRRLPGMVREGIDARALHVLEERLGLPHSPQALSRGDFDRGLAMLGENNMRWVSEPSCANFSKMGRLVVTLARDGELALMRGYLKASPASAPR